MGSTGFRMSLRPLMPLLLFLCLAAPAAGAPRWPDVKIPLEFRDVQALDAWAATAFFGGYEKKAFSRDRKDVVVVIGMHTSGIATSELYVFDKQADESFSLMLWRRMTYEIVSVKDDHDALVFSTERDASGGLAERVVLTVPWDGLVADYGAFEN